MQMNVSQWRPVTQSETTHEPQQSLVSVRGGLPLCSGMLGMVVVANRVRVGRALDSGQTPQPVTPPAWRCYWHLIAFQIATLFCSRVFPAFPLSVSSWQPPPQLIYFLLIFVYISVGQPSVNFDCVLCLLWLALCASCGRFIPHS